MTFNSEEEAYNFYNAYAERVGFSVRKSHTSRRKDGSLQCRYFVCSKEGKHYAHPIRVPKEPRATGRANCRARVEFRVDRKNVWTIKRVELEHTHKPVSPSKVHTLRSHRQILPMQRRLMEWMDKTGITPYQIEEKFNGSENGSFPRMDTVNYVCGQREKLLRARDAQTLLDYFKNKRREDPSFFYAIQVHESGQVANFFWAEGHAIVDYAYFGDVVSFDTTFQTNKCEIPFAPLLGINHQKQTIVFGAALLFDETADSFVWLFKTFLSCMSGKQPATIFANHSEAISRAISVVLPSSYQRLCLRHISQNTATNLSHVIPMFPNFMSIFRSCIYEAHSVEQFVAKWEDMLKTYQLEDNLWLQNLYSLREKWATVFCCDSFCADMRAIQRDDDMNNLVKKLFRKKLSIEEFIIEYHKTLKLFHEKELYEDYNSWRTKPIPFVSSIPMLTTAADSYTKHIYADFEKEFKSQLVSACELVTSDGSIRTFKVSLLDSKNEGIVIFNVEDHTVQCSCKKYECAGILCFHALKVLNYNNVFNLPHRYILKRWTKFAKYGTASCIPQPAVDADGRETPASCYARICQKALLVAIKSSASREALAYVEKGLDILTTEAEALLQGENATNSKSDASQPSITQPSEVDTLGSQISTKSSPFRKWTDVEQWNSP
uniref:Protein FAR1-RELATED SEQUENCE n=1 Tax=Ananas comosus var. bracteatus TaxID=296719 RepID=A0A6V7NIV5_ANACO|nr:unnamed protein product [Ananas comosus var. bracteatus]